MIFIVVELIETVEYRVNEFVSQQPINPVCDDKKVCYQSALLREEYSLPLPMQTYGLPSNNATKGSLVRQPHKNLHNTTLLSSINTNLTNLHVLLFM